MNKNQPHEPDRLKSMNNIGITYECPSCGSTLNRLQDKCGTCKQKIDWKKEIEIDRRTYDDITDDGEW